MLKDWIIKYCKGDKFIWTALVMLIIASCFSVTTSVTGLAYDGRHQGDFLAVVLKHFSMLSLGVSVMIFTSNLSLRFVSGLSFVALIGSVCMVMAVYAVGVTVNGSSRWLSFAGISFQPSEFAKISLIAFLSRLLADHYSDPDKSFWKCIMAIGVVCGVILPENLSTCLLIAISSFVLLLIGRISFSKLFAVGMGAVFLVSLLLLLAPYEPVKSLVPRAATWRARVERFLPNTSGEVNATVEDNDYQANLAKAAVSTGGIVGKGIGKSFYRNNLPMASSDFIFAIILEEWGLIGLVWVILAYGMILTRVFLLSRHCPKPYHSFVMLGLTFLLTFQALINMMVAVGAMPVTGQTLPMISMGGTSNIITGLAYGIILSASEEAINNKNKNDAVVAKTKAAVVSDDNDEE